MQIRFRFSLFALLAGVTLAAMAFVVTRTVTFEISLARLDRQICDLEASDFVTENRSLYSTYEYPHFDAEIQKLSDRSTAFRRLFPRLDDPSPTCQRRAVYVLGQLANQDASLREDLRNKLTRLETEDSDLTYEIYRAINPVRH